MSRSKKELADLKIIGFKIGKRRPTYNKTIEKYKDITLTKFALYFSHALVNSDFLSVRKVESKK